MPVGCSKLYMCNIIPKATVQKVVKCQASQNGIIKKCLNNPTGGSERRQRKQDFKWQASALIQW